MSTTNAASAAVNVVDALVNNLVSAVEDLDAVWTFNAVKDLCNAVQQDKEDDVEQRGRRRWRGDATTKQHTARAS